MPMPPALLDAIQRLQLALDGGGTTSWTELARAAQCTLDAWALCAPLLADRSSSVPLARGPVVSWALFAPPGRPDDSGLWFARAAYARAIDAALAASVVAGTPPIALTAADLVLPATLWENPTAPDGRDFASGAWQASEFTEVTIVLPLLT